MKKILFFFSIFLSISFAFSQEYYLNVNLKDGTKISYYVSEVSRIDFSGTIGPNTIKNLSHIIKSFKLLQNYPNPFNPNTTIQYEIPKNGRVVVSIYDVNGRLIKTIISNNQQAGLHKIFWNGKSSSGVMAASGFYVYTLKFENKVLSKKMLLLK